jgi:hypothetical protein
MTDEEIRLMQEELKAQQEESSKWSWMGVIEKLANGDITKFEEVTKMEFILCLNWLSYWKYKDKKVAKMQEEAQKEYKKIKY